LDYRFAGTNFAIYLFPALIQTRDEEEMKMANRVLAGLTLKELMSKTWQAINTDDVYGASAQLAYYFLLALFPMLIFLISLVGFLPEAQQTIFNALGRVFPYQTMQLVTDTMHDIVTNRSGRLLSFGILGTIWAASGGVAALMGTLNLAYHVKEWRSFWKVRLIAIGLTMMLSFMIIGGIVLLIFVDKFSVWVATLLGLEQSSILLAVAEYLLGLFLLLLGIEVIYHFAPNIKLRWKLVTPGGLFALVALIVSSHLFSLYLRYAPSYSVTYGSLGAVIILMLWLYVMGMTLLVGGEINSVIREAAGIPKVLKEEPKQNYSKSQSILSTGEYQAFRPGTKHERLEQK
jgi:membrane protein